MAKASRGSLRAADIMKKDVVVVSPEDSLQEALALITENHVTGLPVLDGKNRCVGLVSATDILTYEQDHAESAVEANADVARYFDPEQQRWESLRVGTFALEEFSELPISEIMSRDLIAVSPETPIREVASRMIEDNVHRILVLDEKNLLLGIISSFDFVRLAAEE